MTQEKIMTAAEFEYYELKKSIYMRNKAWNREEVGAGVLYFTFVAICFASAVGLDSLLHYIFK
ncbi:hypothetical protein [Burkholderia contaminans]|uniref:hypothetical protein n=1 Tax=Burkholderia contaminans TaxID=488447 RepID=UPI00158C1004|nr:hypothetical protein [Burkholderia contaminans]